MKFSKRGATTATNYIKLADHVSGDILINGDKFAGIKEVTGKSGPFNTYLFESDEGEITSLPSAGQLKYLLETESQVKVGERVQITYLGKEMVNTRNINQFELLVEEL